MIRRPSDQRPPRALRSQQALEFALLGLAGAITGLLLRIAFLAVGAGERLWSTAFVFRMTDPLVWPLTQLPGAQRPVLGAVTLPEITAFAISALLVVFVAAPGRR